MVFKAIELNKNSLHWKIFYPSKRFEVSLLLIKKLSWLNIPSSHFRHVTRMSSETLKIIFHIQNHMWFRSHIFSNFIKKIAWIYHSPGPETAPCNQTQSIAQRNLRIFTSPGWINNFSFISIRVMFYTKLVAKLKRKCFQSILYFRNVIRCWGPVHVCISYYYVIYKWKKII